MSSKNSAWPLKLPAVPAAWKAPKAWVRPVSRSNESWNARALPITTESTGDHGSARVSSSAPYSGGSGLVCNQKFTPSA